MSEPEKKAQPPVTNEQSNESGFEAERDPLNAPPAQAEASEYGIYGYVDEAGEALEPQPPPPPTDPAPDEGDAPGGQRPDQTRHGSGFDQPRRPADR